MYKDRLHLHWIVITVHYLVLYQLMTVIHLKFMTISLIETPQDITTGINEQSTSGLTVTFNNTENTVGSYGTYNTQYVRDFGDGDTTVNAGSGANGDTGNSITHRYSTNTEQANGTAVDYTGNLTLNTPHGSSPHKCPLYSTLRALCSC